MIRWRQEGVGVGVGVGAERVATTEEEEEAAALIPGLPDEIALRCIARLPGEAHRRAKAVSHAWRRTLQSEEMWKLRRKLGRKQHFLCLFRDHPAVAQAELFEPSTGTWTCLPLLPYPPGSCQLGRRFAAVGLGGSVYVIGGYAEPCSSLFRFDCHRIAEGGRWESLQGMHHWRCKFACAALADQEEEGGGGGGLIVTVGGAAAGSSRTVEVYDVARDKWNRFPDLPSSKSVNAPAFFFPRPHPHPHPHPHHLHRGGGGGGGWDLWIMAYYGMGSMYRFFTDVAVPSSVSASGDGEGEGEGWHRLPPPTWHHGGRHILTGSSVAVIHGRGGRETSAAAYSASQVYAALGSSLYRYDIAYNRWDLESSMPEKIVAESSYSLVALNDELYVVPTRPFNDYHSTQASTRRPFNDYHFNDYDFNDYHFNDYDFNDYHFNDYHFNDYHSTRASTRERITLVSQVYNPRKQSWRLMSTTPPMKSPLKLPFVDACSLEL